MIPCNQVTCIDIETTTAHAYLLNPSGREVVEQFDILQTDKGTVFEEERIQTLVVVTRATVMKQGIRSMC
jgi:hypothetical protein